METADYARIRGLVLDECARTLAAVDESQVRSYLDALLGAEQIFFVGVGRVLLSLQATAKRYSHLGLKAVVVGQITEPAITDKDLLVVGSGSGETLFPLGIARKAKSLGARVAHLGSNPGSSMAQFADFFVRLPTSSRKALPDEVASDQPMTSLFEQSLLLFGDITAKMIIEENGLVMSELWKCHANLE